MGQTMTHSALYQMTISYNAQYPYDSNLVRFILAVHVIYRLCNHWKLLDEQAGHFLHCTSVCDKSMERQPFSAALLRSCQYNFVTAKFWHNIHLNILKAVWESLILKPGSRIIHFFFYEWTQQESGIWFWISSNLQTQGALSTMLHNELPRQLQIIKSYLWSHWCS